MAEVMFNAVITDVNAAYNSLYVAENGNGGGVIKCYPDKTYPRRVTAENGDVSIVQVPLHDIIAEDVKAGNVRQASVTRLDTVGKVAKYKLHKLGPAQPRLGGDGDNGFSDADAID